MDSSTPTDGLAVRRVPLDALHLDPANARAHGPGNMEAIKASLSRFGQAEPLVVQAGTGRVIGGNGRLAAMRNLAWTECDIVELPLDDLQATALGIALNRTAELAEWDEPALGAILAELREQDALDGVGFDVPDIDDLLASLADDTPKDLDDPGPPEPVEAVSQRGDLWHLGNHRILCGDSTSADDMARLLGDDTPTLMATDPPYCVEYDGTHRPVHNGKKSGKDWSHLYREVEITDFGDFLDKVLTATLPALAKRSPVYVWHAHLQQHVLAAMFEKHGLLLHQILVWVKPTGVFGHSYYRWRHEPCAFGWKRGSMPQHGTGKLDTVWEVDWEGRQRVVGNSHPTQKPTRLFEIPMELHTRTGDVVLEPFSGSGSQIITAEKLSRRCRAMELQPVFVDVAIRRWQEATGEDAVLDGDGRTWCEVSIDRGDA